MKLTLGDTVLNLLAKGVCLRVVGLEFQKRLVKLAGIVVVAELEVAESQVEEALTSPVRDLAIDVYELPQRSEEKHELGRGFPTN